MEYTLCSRCGQSLKYVFYFEGKPVGGDCFERLTGIPFASVHPYIDRDGNIDLAARERDIATRQRERAEAEAARDAQWAAVASENAWLIELLAPHATFNASGEPFNFFASIIQSLRIGTRYSELPPKAMHVISKTVGGRTGSKKYYALMDRLTDTQEAA